MAFAISCVSSVPAEPTTVPAMIIAALLSTKPSNATASPVSALYSEMTTGMSAPPIGSVIVTPSSSASANSNATWPGMPPPWTTMIPPATVVTARIAKFTKFWPRNRKLRLMSPWSLPKAMRLPENDTAPMMPPSTPSVSTATPWTSPANSSTAAMAPAAPPPMPL